jgi:hypothetical protein
MVVPCCVASDFNHIQFTTYTILSLDGGWWMVYARCWIILIHSVSCTAALKKNTHAKQQRNFEPGFRKIWGLLCGWTGGAWGVDGGGWEETKADAWIFSCTVQQRICTAGEHVLGTPKFEYRGRSRIV